MSVRPGRAASQNLLLEGLNCKFTASRQMNCTMYPGRESLAEPLSPLALFPPLTSLLISFDRKPCMSSRCCPSIINIIKWFIFSDFVKRKRLDVKRVMFKFWVVSEVILQRLHNDFTVHLSWVDTLSFPTAWGRNEQLVWSSLLNMPTPICLLSQTN